MKNFVNKRVIILFLITLVVLLVLFLCTPPKPSEKTNEHEAPESNNEEYLLKFPDSEDSFLDVNTPDEIIDLVLACINDESAKIPCNIKSNSTEFEIADKEGYRDLSRSFDLNSDGTEELLVMPIEVCGSVTRGASGNGSIYIFQQIGGKWTVIGDVLGNGLKVSSKKTNNYYNIETNYHMSACTGVTFLYNYQITDSGEGNGVYQQVSENEYDHCEVEKN